MNKMQQEPMSFGPWISFLRTARRSLQAAAIASCAIIGLCAQNTPASGAERITVAKAADDFALVIAEFGVDRGIFKRHNLDLDVTLLTQAKMVQAVIAGSIDIALASGTTIAFAAKGVPFKAVAAIGGPPQLLVLLTRDDGSIKDVSALKGRIAAVTSAGSLTDWAVSRLAVRQGWTATDIRRVSVGDTPARIATLRTKGADAAVVDISVALELETRGEARILVRFGDIIKDFQNQVVFASDNMIAKRPEAVRSFLSAWLETIDYAYKNRTESVAFSVKALRITQPVAEKIYDELMGKSYLVRNGRFNKDALSAMSSDLLELKLLDKPDDLSKYTTEAFLPTQK
ncbi:MULTISPECIES: ABC transporter substrate-binding protein [unclassified Beijerinckia]|uniref:ABC transporter substrate-binding protein n=1 Tax=unclassified Beijerinckia TaxID=2638183 RepID=UPI00089CEE8F|nr:MULTISPECIES: ABC transporter substrate-binding protein [unclassified Beijerinckia]MDH7798961.1 NitT/TauT family transport system substrate-binding protein [Beijerinckia sp. GAS462]SED85836.1 ABC-type nitrate/sulfonate/bicarbonate transport system, substrate-binding protein [Beijerinckia sp. 28-YEA-48]